MTHQPGHPIHPLLSRARTHSLPMVLFASRCLGLPPCAGWRPHRALEGVCEGGFRIVAGVERNGCDRTVRFTQQASAKLDVPAGQVLHRRLAEVMHESLMQGRSRQADFVSEFFDAPRVIGLCMHAFERLADKAVAQSRQPSGCVLGQRIEIAAGGIDEHHFCQPFKHGITAGAGAAGFGHRLVDDACDSVAGVSRSQVQNAGKHRNERVERLEVATEKPAYGNRVGFLDR